MVPIITLVLVREYIVQVWVFHHTEPCISQQSPLTDQSPMGAGLHVDVIRGEDFLDSPTSPRILRTLEKRRPGFDSITYLGCEFFLSEKLDSDYSLIVLCRSSTLRIPVLVIVV